MGLKYLLFEFELNVYGPVAPGFIVTVPDETNMVVASNGPGAPVAPAEPVEPVEPVVPVEPVEPAAPVEPV